MFEDVEDDLESYSISPEEADRESARRSLIRMFPDLDEEELIELEDGKLMRYTLNRVLDTMLHLRGPSFNMNRTFDNGVFYKAVEEAYDYALWLESDDLQKPESLIYREPEEYSEQVEVVENVKEPLHRKPRGIAPNSRYQQSIPLVTEAISNGMARNETVEMIVNKFGLNRPTAESYYSKIKSRI